MVFMALDHTRDFFAVPGQNPTNLATASAVLFLTRWITHFCAPTFCLLTGTGAGLALRSRTTRELSQFLWRRGLWLIVLEVTVVRCLAYQFNVDYRLTLLLVLWSLGWAMVLLSVLVYLPVSVVTAIGVAMIAGHNLFDGINPGGALWTLLHAQGFAVATPPATVFVAYPLVPWIGVTAVGYGLASVYTWPAERRRTFLLRLGLALVAAFVVLRGINGYGDPGSWRALPSPLFTVLSFLNTTKNPPSLLFLLMTLGPALVALALLERGLPRLGRFAITLGREPLFYYAGHFALIHLAAVVVAFVRNGPGWWMFDSPELSRYPFTPPPDWGYSLPVVYLIWVLVVAVMYGLCRWYAGVKARHTDWWWKYV